MMTPNSDNKAGARSARTTPLRNNEEYYEIRGQRCYYFANEYLPSATTLIASSLQSKREIHSSSELVRLCAKTRSPVFRSHGVSGWETRVVSLDLQSGYFIFKETSRDDYIYMIFSRLIYLKRHERVTVDRK